MSLAAFVLVAFATGWSSAFAQGLADPAGSPVPVGWACQLAFDTPAAATHSTEPGASSAPDAETDAAWIDESMRYCISVAEWSAAAAAHPDLFAGTDPLGLFALRCLDPATGLDAYTACHAYLAELDPSITRLLPTAESDVSAGTTSPVVGGIPYVRVPRDLARRIRDEAWNSGRFDIEVPVRRGSRSAVSTRYFTVVGDTPTQVMRSLRRRSLPICGLEAWGCVVRRSPGGGIRRLRVGGGCTRAFHAAEAEREPIPLPSIPPGIAASVPG